MDQPKFSLNPDDSVIFTKNVAMWGAILIFALEAVINFKQARLSDCQSQEIQAKGLNDGVVQRPEGTRRKKTKHVFQTMTASHFMLFVILFMITDVGPWLWGLVGHFQAAFLPSFTDEFWRSCLFVLSSILLCLALNLPNFILRSLVLKEDVFADCTARWRSTLKLHELARGNAMPTVLLLLTGVSLVYQGLGIKVDRSIILVFMATQIAFAFFYPIVTQPQKKHMSLLEPGAMKDSIHELAFTAKFKLKNVYISDGPLPIDIEDGVQTFGWPRMRHFAIHKSVIEQCTTEDVMALVAQQLGCWKYSNHIRTFLISQTNAGHAFLMAVIFIRQKASYSQFNFPPKGYPKVAGILVFAVGFAPIFWLYFTLQMNFMRRKNAFICDKYAAELGYSSELSVVLSKMPAAASEMKIDWLYSLYHNSVPQISERLDALEKLRENEEGAISLPTALNEKL